nr:retrovirus-related Pol polyprotein from transposon TNT 1-94 [Tanacetum cinerariifolium]
NGVVERRNRTLVEAARTMLIFSRAPLFLWAEAIATTCFNKNRSIIHRRFNKTPYELINGKKPDISFLHVFGALCYPKNDREDIGKLGAKGDIGFFIGYSADSCAYRIYNRRTKKIMETMNVSFDELSAMAFEQRSSKPMLQSMTSGYISPGLDLTYAPSTITMQQPSEGMAECLALIDLDASINLMPFSVWKRLSLPDLTPTCSFYFSADFVVVDFDADPRVPLILERSFLKTERALIDVFESELTLRVGKEAITFILDQTSRYIANYSDMTAKRIDVLDMACEEYSQEVLGFSDVELKDLPPHLEYAFLEGDNNLTIIIAKDLSMEEKTALITLVPKTDLLCVTKRTMFHGRLVFSGMLKVDQMES